MTLRNEVRFEDLEEHDTVLPADAELLVMVGDEAQRAPVSQLPTPAAFNLYNDVATEATTLADDDRLLGADVSETGNPNVWISVTNFVADLKNKIGNATTAVAGLMSAEDKTKLDALDKEQIRIDEFIDSDGVVMIDDYSIVASYNGTVNGSSIFAQDTYSIYYQDGASTPHNYRAFLSQIKAGWQLLVHRTSSPPQYVFSDVTAVEWQDTNGNATTTLSDAVTFKFWVSIDDERGLDAYGELSTGAVRLHWKVPLDETYVELDGGNAGAFTGTPDDLLAVQGGAVKKYDFDDARRHLLGPKSHVGLGTFAVQSGLPNAAGKVRFQVTPGQSIVTVNITWSTTDEETDLATYLISGQRLAFGSGYSGEITDVVNKNTIANGGFGFSITDTEGAPPSTGNIAIVAEGQERVTRIAYIETVQNTGNMYYGSADPNLLALDESAAIHWKANVTSTGAATLNVNALGAKSVKKPDGAASASGDIVANAYYLSIFRDDAWITYGIADYPIAGNVSVDASGFDGNLATTDTDVQKVAQKVDDLTAVKGWQGVRRRLGAKLTDAVAAADTWNNLLTISITPDAVGQKLRLRMQIYVARGQGATNLLGIAARKVIGSWDGGLHDTTADTRDYSPLVVRQFAQSNAWLDWIIEPFVFEAEFTAESTTTVKINVGAFCLNQADPIVREAGTLYINRAQNLPASNWPGADSNYFSWVELTKFADGNEDITETVITALDAA